MTAHSKGKETDLSSSSTLGGAEPNYSVLAGEDLSFSDISGNRDSDLSDLSDLIQSILHRNCDAVLKIAAPCTSDVHTMTEELSNGIAADLESRLSRAAQDNGRNNNSRDKGRAKDPRGKGCTDGSLDAWVMAILKWTGFLNMSSGTGTRRNNDLEARPLDASHVTRCCGAFLLFVAHHVREHLTKYSRDVHLTMEACRLILPITNDDVESEDTDTDTDTNSTDYIDSTAYVDPADFANVECGMFPIGSIVDRQAAQAPHLVVADAEMVRHKDDYGEAELRLATKTKAMFFNQHNRRFAWGLATCSRIIRAYVFGTDDIWASTAMDISSAEGRQAFISLLVDWSLCSVNHLGFDPTIRYEIDHASGDPYLAIDVVEMVESTDKTGACTYYSQQCVGAADRLTGRHDRYFTASASLGTLDKPTFLIKDVWTASGSESVGDDQESSFLNVLHAEFDKSSEFGGRFSRLVSTGPVPISQGDPPIMDSTATAFAGLPNVSRVRQHRRTVAQWAGNMISEADNPSQVVVAVADAMAALNAAYDKCKIFHGNISDRAIQIQETADGIKGVLADFDYASYAPYGSKSAGIVEAPEQILFLSIRNLEDPDAIRTLLDDCESLLYLVCWLGTFGINRAKRMEYAMDYAARRRGRRKPCLPIFDWVRGNPEVIARYKRSHMASERTFCDNILSNMHEDSPLRHLALDIYRVLFLPPGCYGTSRLTNQQLEEVADINTRNLLLAVPAINGRRDPLILRIVFEKAIILNLLEVLARHRAIALAALDAGGDDESLEAATLPSVILSTMKHHMDEAAVAGPSKRLRP
ncbi:hypothetical protein FBU31_000916 [Coemansia sp. 'formosensis']|nr:hypothetical protein FBU31_000916 [Coemansia sp. 'formosensis']